MKLLLDQNLSSRLVGSLSNSFPDSAHVRDLGLAEADDAVIWEFAREREFAIVSKDSDFHQLSFLQGPPPKVIWIRRGNCSSDDISRLLGSNEKEILEFGADPETAFLVLS